MKYCIKSEPEPKELTDFRVSYPDADWDSFKDIDKSNRYSSIARQLHSDQKGLCAFCEIAPSENNRQIAHFHPKSDHNGSHNWALDWHNIWLCCKGGYLSWLDNTEEYLPPLPENLSCDQVKADLVLDGLILKPNEVPLFPRIFRYEQWIDEVHIQADVDACNSCNINPELFNNTIIKLNLNCRRLARARLTILKHLEVEINLLRKSRTKTLSSTYLLPKWLGVQSDNTYRKFFTLIRWRLHDTGAEDFLRNTEYKG